MMPYSKPTEPATAVVGCIKSLDQKQFTKNTLHHAIAPFLFTARIFGLFPISGVFRNGNVRKVRFRWCYWATFLSFLLWCLCAMDLFLTVKMVFQYGLKIFTAGPLNFSIVCLCAFTVFFSFALTWPDFIRETNRFEISFIEVLNGKCGQENFTKKIRWIGFGFLIGAFEHMTYVSSAVYKNYRQIEICNLTVDFWEHYFQRERLQIFSIFNYSVWLVPLVEYITISMTFAWNFVDIFLTLICKSLALRFHQFHEQIKMHVDKPMPTNFWQRIRLELTTLTQLLQYYDKKLSKLMLLACSHNVLWICVQIFYSFIHKGNFVTEIYFWYSLIFVLTRFLTMMFTAADVHDTARMIASTLFEIPTAYWCSELKRLNELIVADVYALSGKGFFTLTRALIFAMAAKILVYELVLLDNVDGKEVHRDVCALRY